MAGPALAAGILPLWNPTTYVLTVQWDAFLTSAANADGDWLLTDADGLLWKGPAAGTTIDASGISVLAVVSMERDVVRTPGTASTLDIAAAAVASAGGNNLAIIDSAFNLAIDHSRPYTSTDLTALWTGLQTVFNDGDFSSYDGLQKADMLSLLTRMLKNPRSAAQGFLLRSPRTEDRAYALITQMNKFNQSTKAPDDLQRLQAAVEELRASLNPSGTFQMLPNGT